ncbi:unnamed protein product, partial [Arctogadus glacialis]
GLTAVSAAFGSEQQSGAEDSDRESSLSLHNRHTLRQVEARGSSFPRELLTPVDPVTEASRVHPLNSLCVSARVWAPPCEG